RLGGRRAEVRGYVDGVELEQGRLGRRLGREDVEGGTGDASFAHGVGERGFVDDAATRGVDHAQGRLRVLEHVGVDEAHRVARLRQVDREEVRLRDEIGEVGDELDTELAGTLRRHVRVVRGEPHAERERTLRDEHTDAAEADDAERLAVQLDALPARAVPLPRLQVRVRLRDVARLREHQRDRVL